MNFLSNLLKIMIWTKTSLGFNHCILSIREPNTSYKSHILNTTFEVIKIERKYWNENGCRAFRRQLVSDIRENNVIM